MSDTKPIVDWRQLSKIERKITADEHGGVMDRWDYGHEVLKAKVGRKQLPDGMIADLVNAARQAGKTISEREIQYRVKLATVYATDQQVRKVIADLGSWTEIIRAGFPEVTVDDELPEPDDEEAPTDGWEQLSLLPGFKPVFRLRGQDMKTADATVPDVLAYRDKYRSMHESFGKALDLIENTVNTILEGWDGNPEVKAVVAYQKGASK